MNSKFFDVKKDKQDAIINAALHTFALKGYKDASTDVIVKEAGISKGLLFHYFTSKQGLYDFICDYSTKYMILELTRSVKKNQRDLFQDGWWIYTRTTDSNPSRIYDTSKVKDSMIANGCQVEGTVEHSIIGRGVHIGKGAVVRNSVILDYAKVGDGVTLDSQIVDKYAKVIRTKELISESDKPGYVHRADTL